MNIARLYEKLTDAERIEVIGQFPIQDVLSAPGHTKLRNPDAVADLASRIARGEVGSLFHEPILIGIFTVSNGSEVTLRSVECLDGHHRLLAGFLAGVWDRIEDLPIGAIETRVNGWRIDGDGPEDRWIPLDVAVRSTLSEDQRPEVPEEAGAKGPTARISGEISSRDPIFARADRGVYFGQLARAWAIDTMIGLRAHIGALEERISQREGNQ